jgi:hypothetical protein
MTLLAAVDAGRIGLDTLEQRRPLPRCVPALLGWSSLFVLISASSIVDLPRRPKTRV